ncbi:MAG: L-rhamnose mutarotase [Rhodobacteraceae bacterium]|nr:L-rhamnose mutarotase [Paracoccaceae bacterium]
MSLYRRAWSMQLREGAEAAYDRAHAEIWPALLDQMRQNGIRRYFLYRAGLTVFAFQERSTPYPEAGAPATGLQREWWARMAPLMHTGPEGRPLHTELTEVFALSDPKEPCP